jgi:hypothetical protein
MGWSFTEAPPKHDETYHYNALTAAQAQLHLSEIQAPTELHAQVNEYYLTGQNAEVDKILTENWKTQNSGKEPAAEDKVLAWDNYSVLDQASGRALVDATGRVSDNNEDNLYDMAHSTKTSVDDQKKLWLSSFTADIHSFPSVARAKNASTGGNKFNGLNNRVPGYAKNYNGSEHFHFKGDIDGGRHSEDFNLFFERPQPFTVWAPRYAQGDLFASDEHRPTYVNRDFVKTPRKSGLSAHWTDGSGKSGGNAGIHLFNVILLLSKQDINAKLWAHKLILNADRTRAPAGDGAAAINAAKQTLGDEKVEELIDVTNPKTAYRAQPNQYSLTNDVERNLLYLECRPKTSRAYHALKWVFAEGRDGVRSKGNNNLKQAWTVNYEPDPYSDVNTPTVEDRQEWIADKLQAEGIHYAPTPTTHPEPDARRPGKVKHVLGKAGPKAEDGRIQQGHYMRVGNRPSAVREASRNANPNDGVTKVENPNQHYVDKTIFWVANQPPPPGTRSLWIPTHKGAVVEVWFSQAPDEYAEEEAAAREERTPYMLYSDQKANRGWEIDDDTRRPTGEVPSYDGQFRGGGGDYSDYDDYGYGYDDYGYSDYDDYGYSGYGSGYSGY